MMLLDEPFGALDALTRIEMQRWLEERWQASRWTTLLVTHDVREAVCLSDRIYVLSPRPARVVREFAVPLDRPRLAHGVPPEAHALEDEILQTLLDPQGATDARTRLSPPSSPHSRSTLKRSASPSTGPPTPTMSASTSPRRRAGTTRPASTSRSCPIPTPPPARWWRTASPSSAS